MTRIFTFLSLAVIGRLALAAGPEVRITVAVEFQSEARAALQPAVQAEVRRAIPLDWLGIEWRNLDSLPRDEAFQRLVIVRVRGSCLSPADPDSRALGLAHGVEGRIQPFIEIDCDRVAGILRRLPGELEPSLLGRALGRVVAHELYHVLGDTEMHSERGLAQPSFGLKELSAERISFRRGDLERIEARLRAAGIGADGGQ